MSSRICAVLAALLLSGSVFASQHKISPREPGFMGKTSAQIVKMGSADWFTYYTKKKGDSMADMMNAQILYGYAMMLEDDKFFRHLPKSRQRWLLKLRKVGRPFLNSCFDMAQQFGGRDVSLRLMRADGGSIMETLVLRCAKAQTGRQVQAPSVLDDLNRLDSIFHSAKSNRTGQEDFDLEQARKDLKTLKSHCASMKNLLKGSSKQDQARLRGWMHEQLVLARGEPPEK